MLCGCLVHIAVIYSLSRTQQENNILVIQTNIITYTIKSIIIVTILLCKNVLCTNAFRYFCTCATTFLILKWLKNWNLFEICKDASYLHLDLKIDSKLFGWCHIVFVFGFELESGNNEQRILWWFDQKMASMHGGQKHYTTHVWHYFPLVGLNKNNSLLATISCLIGSYQNYLCIAVGW